MRFVDLISKKKAGGAFSELEINFIITSYLANETKDYQMSALLMAIVFQGMSAAETTFLTWAMLKSGATIDLKAIKGIKVDKHSTGGVGDKTTLAVAPIVAALGAPVAKMSGRGLGHTGGTLDKLESIPGFNVTVGIAAFQKQVNEIGIAIIGQTSNLVPADQRLYALRDVSATVDSIPLIASSIMAKKLATGADAILLDVKCGNGAFMKTLAEARKLAQMMIAIGALLKRDVKVDITSMDRPLGRMIGNKNEVLEAIALLDGKTVAADFETVVYSAAAIMLVQAQIFPTKAAAKDAITKVIKSKAALQKFYEMVTYQGGDVAKLQAPQFWNPAYNYQVKATKAGYFNILSASKFGIAAMQLGAGRSVKSDQIDMEAGIYLNQKTNQKVQVGTTLFTLYSSKPIKPAIPEQLKSGYEIRHDTIKNEVIIEQLS